MEKRCINRQTHLKNTCTVLSWCHRHCVWLVANGYKWLCCFARVCCETDNLGLFSEDGLYQGQFLCRVCMYVLLPSFLIVNFDVCCFNVFTLPCVYNKRWQYTDLAWNISSNRSSKIFSFGSQVLYLNATNTMYNDNHCTVKCC